MPGQAGFVVYRAWILAKKLWWPIYTWSYIYIWCARVYSCIVSPPILGRVWWHSSHFFHPIIYLWWVSWSIFFCRFMVYHWGVYWICRCEIFFVLFLVCFFKLLNFLVVQLQCMTHYYHTLYLMMSFRCSTLTRFKVYLANWKCSFGTSICLKKSMLGSWNRAFSIEFEKSIRKPKKIVYLMGYET